jgi:hypothetical protein
MNTLMAILALAGLVGSGVSAWKKNKYAKEAEKKVDEQNEYTKKEGLKNALSRVLDVETTPYIAPPEMPKAPDTTWSDTLAGASQAGMQGLAMYQAPRRYPLGDGGGAAGYQNINDAYRNALRTMR